MVAGSGAAVVAGSVPMTFIHSGSSVVASRGSGVGRPPHNIPFDSPQGRLSPGQTAGFRDDAR
jgi:hypothetical protein